MDDHQEMQGTTSHTTSLDGMSNGMSDGDHPSRRKGKRNKQGSGRDRSHQRSYRSSQPQLTVRKKNLQSRLEELNILILRDDGGPGEYKTMTLRVLYDYVMNAITARPQRETSINFGDVASSVRWRGHYPITGSTNSRSMLGGSSAVASPMIRSIATPTTSGNRSRFSISTMTTSGASSLPPPPPLTLSDGAQNNQQPLQQQTSSGGKSDSAHGSNRFVSFLPSATGHATFTAGGGGQGQPPSPTAPSGGIPFPPTEYDQHNNHLQPPTYRERLGGYLHPRDMRRLVTPFSSTNEPELIVRRHVMLLNFDKLRAIVLRDRLLVLVPPGSDSVLLSLEKRVTGGIGGMNEEIFGEEDGVDSSDFGEWMGATGTETPPSVDDPLSVGTAVPIEKKKKSSSPLGHDVAEDNLKEVNNDDKNGPNDDEDNQTNSSYTETSDDNDALSTLDDNEMEDIDQMNWMVEMPFELQCVDAVLYTVVSLLSHDADEVRDRACLAMKALVGGSGTSSSPGEHAQEKLRLLKDQVKEEHRRLQGFVRALNQVLDEDEDMALMNLSRLITHPDRFIQPVSEDVLHEESDEPELILEAYLQHALSTSNALEKVTNQIATTEEHVAMMLDSVRNRLLYINTLVSLLSVCVAIASLVGSIFGMNLTNSLEYDDNAFRQVVAGTLCGSFGLLLLLVGVFHRAGKMPTEALKF